MNTKHRSRGSKKASRQAGFWRELSKNLNSYGLMLQSTGLVHQEGEEMIYRDPPEEARTRAAGKVLTGIAWAIEASLSACEANNVYTPVASAASTGEKKTSAVGAALNLSKRITNYLASGGLFNPEMANHDRVRDLLIDCREFFDEAARVEPQAVSANATTPTMRDVPSNETGNPWIRTADRPPTREDADNFGMVFTRNEIGGCIQSWEIICEQSHVYPLWMPIPPVPDAQQTPTSARHG
jgi:hypothetical protein